jgi:hypothetical protein
LITAIVFSRDRACQLDALLSTIVGQAPGMFKPTRVLYTSTEGEFESGYGRCKRRHPWPVYLRESVFREDVLALLPHDGLVCFFTDDDVLYRWVRSDIVAAAFDDPSVVAFSLRLGFNTRRCYPHDCVQHMPPVDERDGFIVWNWPEAHLDFGYPLSLDGHVLRASDVRTLLEGHDFSSPNQLEDVLAQNAGRLKLRPKLASFPLSCLVGLPVNRVNDTHPNRHSSSRSYPVRDLNLRYLAGDVILPGRMDFSEVAAAHQEVALELDYRGAGVA